MRDLDQIWKLSQHEVLFPRDPVREFRVSMTWRDAADRWWLRYNGELRGPRETHWPEPSAVRPDDNELRVDIDEMAYRAIGAPPKGRSVR